MTRWLVLGLGLTVACSGGSSGDGVDAAPALPDAPPGAFIVPGTITGDGARAGDFNGLFTVKIGQPSLYSLGLGRSTDGATFRLPMPPSPPTAAQNGGTTATAYVVMTELDDSIENGQISEDVSARIIGISPDHMIVYRSAPFVTQFPWEDQFPSGWSCGLCQQNPVAGMPDSLTPVDCSQTVVKMGNFSSMDSCDLFGQ